MTTHEQMLISAMRYALGRRTYIVSTTCQYLIDMSPHLSSQCKLIMIRDIKEQSTLGYGDECDKQSWMKLLQELENSIGEINESRT